MIDVKTMDKRLKAIADEMDDKPENFIYLFSMIYAGTFAQRLERMERTEREILGTLKRIEGKLKHDQQSDA